MNITEDNLRVVPAQVAFLDERAAKNWPVLLKRAGVTLGSRHDEKRLYMLRNFGLPDLLFRLECQVEREQKAGGTYDHVARATIWLHVAEALSEGKDIADTTSDTRWRLNPFLPSNMKFHNARLDALNAREKTRAPRLCANERCRKGENRQRAEVVGRAKCCSKSCRNTVSRGYRANPVRPHENTPLRPA